MKYCAACQLTKDPSAFGKDKRTNDGRNYRCKQCDNVLSATRRAANPARRQATVSAYRQRNKDKINLGIRRVKQERKEIYNADTARRRAQQKQAIPPWANLESIKGIYAEAAAKGLEVDHIVPLRSKYVCGLHVANNLSLLTRAENIAKGNRQWPGQ